MTKYVYTFGGGSAEGKASDKNLLGGKGQTWRNVFTGYSRTCRFHDQHGVLYRFITLTGVNYR